jgi:hypothetical protein
MPVFDGNQGGTGFTPSAVQNFILAADAAGEGAKVSSVWWGGQAAASMPGLIRFVRPGTAGSGTLTAVANGVTPPGIRLATPLCTFCTAATPPTITAIPNGLYMTGVNYFGGLGRYIMDDREMWEILFGVTGGTQIVCVESLNTTISTMTCGISWVE